ncbi:MAG: DUF3991 and toprim domain-containing protein [Oscillospiraceae bacterium]
MAKYQGYTEEQLHRANTVDLETLLQRRGERLIRSGKDSRLTTDHSITVRGNKWYDHATMKGGLAVSFLQYHWGLPFAEAVASLLEMKEYTPKENIYESKPVPLVLPPRNGNMHWLFAYLINERKLKREVIEAFVHEKLLYESREIAKNGREYHSAVFVGMDEHGTARHCHKKALGTSRFCANAEGSNSEYSFHRTGDSEKLYVFEAPIDLMSYICFHFENWKEHSYVALCGLSEYAMLKILATHPNLTTVILCLDNDRAGIAAAERMRDRLQSLGFKEVSYDRSELKDWNEDLCKKKLSL